MNAIISPDVEAPPLRRLSARQSARRQRILDATLSLLGDHGYEAVSMKMIADRARVAERTLFNIYETKARLVASCARERSEGIIGGVAADAGRPGMNFFRTLGPSLARRTFEAPQLARAFSLVLVEHAALVGLPDLYARHAGAALTAMQSEGQFASSDTQVIAQLLGMRIGAIIVAWANGNIADHALEVHLRLGIAEVLAPHADGAAAVELRDTARAMIRAIASDAA